MRILFVSDTHLGFDTVKQPRIRRRRRADDFLARYTDALAPALRGEVDVVIHGGDVFNVPDVSAGIVDDAFAPLRIIADRGCPVFVIAGNHERSRIPCPLLAMHPGIHIITTPRTQVVKVAGRRLAVGGFAYVRHVRSCFEELVEGSGIATTPADIRLLAVHHCIEGAVVSNPAGDFVFRGAPDVIARRTLPDGVAAVLSGHIHRHQVLPGVSGRPPVIYPGSVERTSLAERDETKGFMTLELEGGDGGGRLVGWRFHPLAARPMQLVTLEASDAPRLLRTISEAIDAAPRDVVLHFRAPRAWTGRKELAAERLRALAPPSMNVTVSFADGAASRRELRRAALAR